MPNRRRFLQTLCVLPVLACPPAAARAEASPAFSQLKAGYAQRLKKYWPPTNCPI